MESARRGGPNLNRYSPRNSKVAKGIPGLKTKFDRLASPNAPTSATVFGHAALRRSDLFARPLIGRGGEAFMSKLVGNQSGEPFCQFFRMGGQFSSQSALEDHIARTAVQYGWQMVPGSRNKICFEAYGYRAITAFEISERETDTMSAQTVFSPLPNKRANWVECGLVLLFCLLVFVLPEWSLGAIMFAAIMYVAVPVILRDKYATTEIRRFTMSLLH